MIGMAVLYGLAGCAALALLAYLGYALVCAEDF